MVNELIMVNMIIKSSLYHYYYLYYHIHLFINSPFIQWYYHNQYSLLPSIPCEYNSHIIQCMIRRMSSSLSYGPLSFGSSSPSVAFWPGLYIYNIYILCNAIHKQYRTKKTYHIHHPVSHMHIRHLYIIIYFVQGLTKKHIPFTTMTRPKPFTIPFNTIPVYFVF